MWTKFFTDLVFQGYHIVVFFIFHIVSMIGFICVNLDLYNLPKLITWLNN